MLLKSGTTRRVLLIGSYAIKLPMIKKGWGIDLFLQGWVSNIRERRLYQNLKQPDQYAFCPVVCSLFFSLIIVMKRTKELEISNHDFLKWYDKSIDQHFNIPERKKSSFGYLTTRIVAIDYGD